MVVEGVVLLFYSSGGWIMDVNRDMALEEMLELCMKFCLCALQVCKFTAPLENVSLH